MAIDVITQGGGEGLVYAFNAVASFFNGKKALGASLIYISTSFGLVLMVMTMVIKQELLPTFKWFFASLILTSTLMLPKIDIIVKDRLTHLERPVANVPYLLGFFAGISSQLGDILAKQMDAIFSKAGPDYRGNGVAMASKLMSKVSHFHIRDPLMASNVRGFVQQCMVFDIAKGKYTLKELHQSDDIWKLLKDNASHSRGFVYKLLRENKQPNQKPVQSKIVTCHEGAESIEAAWNQAYKEAALAYGPRLYPHSPKPNQLFMQNLPLAHHYLTTLSNSAEQILQQSMMANAIDDGLLELNQLTDATAAVTAYAAKRAESQQRAAYALQGSMASVSLSVLKIVVEILFYGLFPIIAAIALFPGGWAVIQKYLIALFWIQSWAPMYAILNMILNVYAKTKSTAVVSTVGKGALNFYALRGGLGEANEWVTSVAGYTMMSVPFLSYGIIHYGAGALSQLATHFGSVTQSAASHAAEEATTGNYSMGNTTFDSHNRHNISGFKYDTNASFASGKTTMQNKDGSLSTRMPDGQNVVDMSPAIPKINSQIKLSDSLASSFNESASHSLQSGTQESRSAAKQISSALNTLNEYRKNRGSDTHASTSFSQQEQAFNESSFAKYEDLVNEFSDSHHMDRVIAHEVFAKVSTGVPLIKSEAGYHFSGKTVDTDTMKEAESYAEKNNFSQLLRASISEAKEGRLNLSDSEGKNYGESISTQLNQADNHIQSAQTHFNEAESYQQQASYIKQNGVSIDQDLSKQYWDSLVNKVGGQEARTIVSDPALNYQEMQSFSKMKRDELRRQFEQESPTNPTAVKQHYEGESEKMNQENNMYHSAERHKENIQSQAHQAGLTQLVQSNIREAVEEGLNNTQQKIEVGKKEILEEKLKLKAEKVKPKISEEMSVWDLPVD
jgi:conjugal transfer mating pair stabilization protein TraG